MSKTRKVKPKADDLVRIEIQVTYALTCKLDESRGLIPRAAWIRDLIEKAVL